MAFVPGKSELNHFNKEREQWSDPVNLARLEKGSSPVKLTALVIPLDVSLEDGEGQIFELEGTCTLSYRVWSLSQQG